jgi:hypothetical protein
MLELKVAVVESGEADMQNPRLLKWRLQLVSFYRSQV